MKLHIYIESGISEERKARRQYTNEWYFVRDYVKHLCPDLDDSEFEIVGVGGKDKLPMFDNQMADAKRANESNLVIFDCDNAAIGGGLDNRARWLEGLKSSTGMDFDYFLFPNNKDDGAFEDLLLHIVNQRHAGILDCFSKYENCLASRNDQMGGGCYVLPNLKAKIYTYITSFNRSKSKNDEIKSGNWDFSNSEYWDLDNEYLAPLKQFLLWFI